jgi:prephenate dehydratase
MKVAIQGIEGCFHQKAANEYFAQKTEPVCCMTFSELIEKVESGEADYGIMAIENMIAGSILPNYDLIMHSNLHIIGEYYLYISQNIMALPGTKIEDVEQVFSHPMAFHQCREYLRSHKLRLIEKEDTALSAKIIQESNIKNTAAIAADIAAEMYGLEIIDNDIQTNKKNYTRFVVLSLKPNTNGASNKASICFSTANESGCLAKVLNVFSANCINLSKIQSHPKIGEDWQYYFYVDLQFDHVDTFHKCKNEILPLCSEYYELGIYKDELK